MTLLCLPSQYRQCPKHDVLLFNPMGVGGVLVFTQGENKSEKVEEQLSLSLLA